MFDGKQFGEDIVEIVKAYVDRRFDELEKRMAGNGDDTAPGKSLNNNNAENANGGRASPGNSGNANN
jgi:hypothetical protein